MKNLTIFFFLCSAFIVDAQPLYDSKADYTWVLGYGGGFLRYRIYLEFKTDSIKIIPLEVNNGLCMSKTNTSYSNLDGDLAFFTNGCKIVDKNEEVIENASPINFNQDWASMCDEYSGYFPHNTIVNLQTFDTVFQLLHLRLKPNSYITELLSSRLTYNVIDSTYKATFTDKMIISDSTFAGHLAACRHANGRDWWVLQPHAGNNGLYTLFVNNDTIINYGLQQLSNLSSNGYDAGTGQAVFSPDGTKYVRYSINTDIQIFDFDRCTGTLSNFIHIPIMDQSDVSFAVGVAIAPNSRYLYVSSTDLIYQFDLQAPDIAASKDTVAIYDGYVTSTGWTTRFYTAQLAPDGKLYVGAPGGKRALHCIEYPDSAGVACQVVQHKYTLENQLPYVINGAMPYFPNYRLGPLAGSPCDTIVSSTSQPSSVVVVPSISVSPNPASSHFGVDISSATGYEAGHRFSLEVYDARGGLVQQVGVSPYSSVHRFECGSWVSGLYYVVLRERGIVKSSSKVVVAR